MSHLLASDPLVRLIISAFMILALIKWVVFLGTIYWKKLLIDAFAQQLADEISRCDIDTPKALTQKMKDTSSEFIIDGLSKVYDAKKWSLFGSANDPEVIERVVDKVVAFNEGKFKGFLYERGTVRWAIEALEGLIGDHQSIEVTWSKGVRYIDRFLDKDRRASLPWIPSFMKLLGLPHNFHASNFEVQAKKAMSRSYPKGYWSLWIATRFFVYRPRLRLLSLQGEEAWYQMMKFKSNTIDFPNLKPK